MGHGGQAGNPGTGEYQFKIRWLINHTHSVWRAIKLRRPCCWWIGPGGWHQSLPLAKTVAEPGWAPMALEWTGQHCMPMVRARREAVHNLGEHFGSGLPHLRSAERDSSPVLLHQKVDQATALVQGRMV
jgi:hypothetical protein